MRVIIYPEFSTHNLCNRLLTTSEIFTVLRNQNVIAIEKVGIYVINYTLSPIVRKLALTLLSLNTAQGYPDVIVQINQLS